ncbi:MAG: SGNH/GDSL hydrolase family protein [Nitriliruptoraceae bacterium]
MTAALSVLVLGDSTAFTDQHGPQLPDTPHLYPNVVVRHLQERLGRTVEVVVVAQPGATVRDALRAATKDRHVQFDLLAHADAVVIGVGSFDHAPAGVPPSVQALVPYLRPDGLRRQVRRGLHAAYPRLIHLRRGRGFRTPPREFQRLYGALLDQVRSITWGRAAGAALGPTSHRSAYYGYRHPGHAQAEARQLAQARAHGFAGVAVWPRVVDHLDALNDDGIHWPAAVHARIGADIAAALVPQLTGLAPTTGLPAVYREHLERHRAADESG